MAVNFVQPGDTLTLPAPAIVASGAPVVAGAIFGIALTSAASGALVDVALIGVWTMQKVSALAIAIGDVVYYDAATGLVNKTSAANLKIGVAVSAASNPSGNVRVRLNGSF